MKIYDIEDFYKVFDRLIKLNPDFEVVLSDSLQTAEVEEFLENDLDNRYEEIEELQEAIESIKLKIMKFADWKKDKFSAGDSVDKIISFIYSFLIKFETISKVQGIPISNNFINNKKCILNNSVHIHHSHINGEIIGYAHSYCNKKVREIK